MKWANKNTIRTKISLPVGLFSSCLLLAIILFTAIKMRSDSLEQSKKLLLAESREYSKQIQLELGKAIVENRTLCEMIGSVKTSANSTLNREEVITLLKLVLQRYPTLLGTYTVWEPNLFDGKDSAYANKEAHDSSGRFIPYVYRNKNNIVIEPIVGYDDPKVATWYFEPKTTKHEMVIDPFYYQNMYMISIIHPIIHEGNFQGITGTDMSMDFIQKLLDGFSLYDGNASIAILSDNQTVVAAYKKPELAGKPIGASLANIPQDLFLNNQEVVEIQNDTLRSFVPFQLGESGKTWVAYIQVPKSVIMKNSNNVVLILCFIGIISVLLLVYGIFYFSGKLTKPILSIATLAEDISIGKLNKNFLIENNSDEADKLISSFTNIVNSQTEITNVCKLIAEGDFSSKALVRSENDELSISVNKMIDNLKNTALEDKKRNWTTEGLAMFAEILRSDNQLSRLSDKIISKLVKYLDANQGGIFILHDEENQSPYLELIACYAFDRKKFLQKQIQLGEGIVGQCFLEKEPIILKQVPDNYVKITSGLGDANPRFILAVPLMIEQNILGVIELASFKVLEPYQIQLVQKLAESIASTIHNININQQTQFLLEKSQIQTEEMKSQEEEMRQNMEELQATQEEMHRKEQGYLEEIERLNKLLQSK